MKLHSLSPFISIANIYRDMFPSRSQINDLIRGILITVKNRIVFVFSILVHLGFIIFLAYERVNYLAFYIYFVVLLVILCLYFLLGYHFLKQHQRFRVYI